MPPLPASHGSSDPLAGIDWYRFLDRPRLPSPTPEMLASLSEESILVTGAGGSIGSALAARLAALQPRCLVLLDASEQQLYRLQGCLAARSGFVGGQFTAKAALDRRPKAVLGSVRDRGLLQELFARHKPSVIFHAAAHKHVALMEENPLAAVDNNILGTRTLAACSADFAAKRLVLLSTDKAAAPCSMLGAAKRVAEQIVLGYGTAADSKRSGVAVRLGNVLGSQGSVVEAWARQIADGGPVTVCEPESFRYFLTIDEAVDLLLAAAIASCADPAVGGQLFAPVLPAPRGIRSLARFLIEQFGSERDPVLASARQILMVGIPPRRGDKLEEVFWSEKERIARNAAAPDGLIAIVSGQPSEHDLTSRLDALEVAVAERSVPAALALIQELVPEYRPSPALAEAALGKAAYA